MQDRHTVFRMPRWWKQFRNGLVDRKTLVRLPVFACAGLVALVFAASVWNLSVERNWADSRLTNFWPLFGVPQPKRPIWTFEAFISGETQKAASSSFAQSLPIYPLFVRARNQFLYSLYGVSGTSGIIIGREHELFESSYIDEFCGRVSPPNSTAIEEWAKSLQAIQTSLTARNKRFIYIITPSKAARYHHYLPSSKDCPSLRLGTTDKLSAFRAALDRSGVNYLDAATLITARMADFPIDLFPRGGTHWNYLGAAVALEELTRLLNRGTSPSPIQLYNFTWHSEGEASPGTDRDLLDLLNLLWPDAKYPVARITGVNKRPCDSPKLLAVGGSFLFEIVANLVTSPCSAHVDYWHYVKFSDRRFGKRRLEVLKAGEGFLAFDRPVSGTESIAGSLVDAEVVILEENESVISTMGQVDDMLATTRQLR